MLGAAASLLLTACGSRSGLFGELAADADVGRGTGGARSFGHVDGSTSKTKVDAGAPDATAETSAPDASADGGPFDAGSGGRGARDASEAGPADTGSDAGTFVDAEPAPDASTVRDASNDGCGTTGCPEACTPPPRNRCGACSVESSNRCGPDPSSDRRACGAPGSCGPTVSCASGDNCVSGTCSACTPTPKTNVPEQHGYGALVSADFNRDGKLDLAVGAELFLGNGDGSFQAPKAIGTDSSLQAAATADLDRDGRPDLVARSSAGFAALVTLGDGTSFASSTIPFEDGYDTYAAVAITNLDRDGFVDALVFASTSTNQLTAGLVSFRGDGKGGFSLAGLTGVDNVITPLDVAAFDFSGDGIPDVAALYEEHLQGDAFTIYTLTGTGNTVFGLPVQHTTDVSGPVDLKVADFDGNQRPDLVASGSGEADVFLSRSDGSLSLSATILVGPVDAVDPAVFDAATGDFNGDGRADVAVPTRDGVEVALGSGDGAFHAPILSAANGAVGLAAGDFDGDAVLDLAVMRSFGVFGVLHGNGDGTFQAAPVAKLDGQLPTSLDVADFNGDGHPDIAAPAYVSVQMLLGDGTGALAPGTAFSEATGSSFPRPYFASSGDLNGDGIVDLVVSYTETAFNGPFANTVGVALGNGDGTFRVAGHYPTGVSPGPSVIGDLDGDCRLDIVVADEDSNDLAILLGKGDGSFRDDMRGAAYGVRAMVLRDFDRDGQLDLAIAGTADVAWLQGSIGGAFFPGVPVVDGSFSSIAAGDLNGDGVLDLAAAGTSARVFFGRGDGRFDDAPPSGLAAAEVAIGDLDADGISDSVFAAADGFHVYMGGPGGLAPARIIPYPGGRAPLSIASPGFLGVSTVVIDATGDGRDDIVFSELDETIEILNLCAP